MARGVAKVFHGGLKPSYLYGAKCLGINDTQMVDLRRSAMKALSGSAGGASLTLRLAVEGKRGDPLYEATQAPIVEWAMAVWDGQVDTQLLAKAWRRQQVEVGMGGGWRAVRGPAGASIMSMKRAGWTWPAWNVMLTRQGLRIDLHETCPMDVKAMLVEDIECQLWAARTREPDLASVSPRPLIAPIVMQLRKKYTDEWGPHAVNAARQAVVHGAWTQQELYRIGKVETDRCQACGEGAGTAHHQRGVPMCPTV